MIALVFCIQTNNYAVMQESVLIDYLGVKTKNFFFCYDFVKITIYYLVYYFSDLFLCHQAIFNS
jgi:hypothetical protein